MRVLSLAGAVVQCVQQLAHLVVDKTHAGQVRLNQRLPLPVLYDPLMGRRHMVEPRQIDSVFRQVIQVVLQDRG